MSGQIFLVVLSEIEACFAFQSQENGDSSAFSLEKVLFLLNHDIPKNLLIL